MMFHRDTANRSACRASRTRSFLPGLGTLLLLALVLPAHGVAQVPDDPIPETAAPPAGAAGVAFDSIAVEGNRLVEEAAILGAFDIPLGQPVTFDALQAGQRRLWETGLFDDLGLRVRTHDDDAVTLILSVSERPLVRRVDIVGLQRLSARDVREVLQMSSGDRFSATRMAKASAFIRDELAAEGVPYARVSHRTTEVEDAPGQIDVILEVEEGHRVALAEVRFEGNSAFSDSELQQAMSSRAEGFFWFRSGEYREEDLDDDLALRIPEFYQASGFLDARVAHDTLIVDPETGKGRLEIGIEEGDQYRVRDFRVTGNRRFPTSQIEQFYSDEQGGLLRSLGIGRSAQEGQPVFDRPAFEDAARMVGEMYRNSGYLFAQVEPVFERARDEDGAPVVDLRFRVQEGQPFYVGNVEIRGNTFTHDRVIREQIAVIPGALYSEQDVLRSYQAVEGLGFFQSPMEIPDIRPDEETGLVDITFHVEEQATGSVNFGTSMGGVTGVAGFIGYDQPNLFGQGKSGSLRWDFGRYQNNFQLQYSDPAIRESRISGQISLFDSRDQFFSFATGERKQRGFSTRFGFPLRDSRFTRLFAGYSLARTEYRLRDGVDDTSLFGRPAGTQSKAEVGIRRFTLNSQLFPITGTELAWTTEFTGGILGGDGSFARHRAEGRWWVPIGEIGGGGGPGSRGITVALGLKARGGAVIGDADRFPFERFWLGGVQFGETLRGYEETTITPRGYVPRGSGQVRDIDRLGDAFLVTGSELAFRFSSQISASVFYEAGNVWANYREIDPTNLARGAGAGLQLVTPFGPIGIDYAYGFDQPNPGWQLHFRMGGMGSF